MEHVEERIAARKNYLGLIQLVSKPRYALFNEVFRGGTANQSYGSLKLIAVLIVPDFIIVLLQVRLLEGGEGIAVKRNWILCQQLRPADGKAQLDRFFFFSPKERTGTTRKGGYHSICK
jgi:hypothetical protein